MTFVFHARRMKRKRYIDASGNSKTRYWIQAMYRFIDLGIYQGDSNWSKTHYESPYKNNYPITRAEMCTVFKYILENMDWITARESYIKLDYIYPYGKYYYVLEEQLDAYLEWENSGGERSQSELDAITKQVRYNSVTIDVLSFDKNTHEPSGNPSDNQGNTSPYDPVISNIIKCLQGQSYDSSYVNGSVHLAKASGQPNAASKVGYCLMDLDNDGSDELLIGDISSIDKSDPELKDFYRYFWSLYTIKDGKAKFVTESWERNRHYLGLDGYVYYEGSGGAANSCFNKMQFKNSDLYILESAFSDIYNGNPCFCYTNFGNGVKESSNDPRAVSAQNADRRNLSESEWQTIWKSWEAKYKSINYKPLTSYKSGEEESSNSLPNAIAGIQATYKGSTEQGTVLDKDNPGIEVAVVYNDGHTVTTQDWNILAPVTLVAGETASKCPSNTCEQLRSVDSIYAQDTR